VELRLSIGLTLTLIAFAIFGRRAYWLYRLITAGQSDPSRLELGPRGLAVKLGTQITEVMGQRKLLQWSVPGVAHFMTMWGFIILNLTIVEAYGALFKADFAIPVIGHWDALGFLEDLFAVLVLLGLATFALIRVRNEPATKGRRSRFYGSHTGAAWLILGMITLVILTLVGYRAAQVKTGVFPYGDGAFLSHWAANALDSFSRGTNHTIETTFILLQLAVVLGFLVLIAYSKHLHIFLAPLNVMFSRRPNALGAVTPMISAGKPVDFENAGDDDIFGVGKVEDFTWKTYLDLTSCTECGRCQSQCPAWNTDKPLSPKLLITDLRDHMFNKAPWLLAGSEGLTPQATEKARAAATYDHTERDHNPNRIPEDERPLLGTAEEGGVIDPDVLWACTNCGACVEQCPVDIEHVDHIMDMRRYQVLVESSFPSEAGVMMRNVENNGNPWGVSARTRNEWIEEMPFEVRVLDGELPEDIEWLFWVGCAGAIDDRARKTTKAFAECLHAAGVSFAVLGEGESCTGDPIRRLGNEYLWSEIAKANVELLQEAKVTKILVTCPHCYNSLSNEYEQVGGQFHVVHHTELLAELIADGRLTPVQTLDQKITYHDPCFLGRHNSIYTPPREVLVNLPGAVVEEMPRNKERSFCCGAGGARMWLEETIGTRINVNRTEEALALEPDVIAVGCPFCKTMISDAVNASGVSGVEVADVAQLLARALQSVQPAGAGGGGTAQVPPAP
jgi:Fe-S oxidoreductase